VLTHPTSSVGERYDDLLGWAIEYCAFGVAASDGAAGSASGQRGRLNATVGEYAPHNG
jgi:hypothetical protein